jgi:hypothetical protein
LNSSSPPASPWIDDQLRVDVSLKVGSVKEAVTVEVDAVQVETESTQLGQVVSAKQILSLPLNGRSFIDLLGLQAAVAPTTSGSISQDRSVSGILSAGNTPNTGRQHWLGGRTFRRPALRNFDPSPFVNSDGNLTAVAGSAWRRFFRSV